MNEIFPSASTGPFGRRLKRARGVKVPVTVLTGFLGAGKTTLLKRFLETPEGAGTAVVINEFGAAGIDDALVRESADETVLIGNGCLCCVARSDLQETLRSLLIERARGELPDFKRIVIETSGLADPSPILQTFATDRALGDAFYLELVVTVADAATGMATLEWSPEARKQAIFADRIIVTKTDIADAEPLRQRLRGLNANAEILEAIDGVIDPRCFTEPGDGARNPFIAEAEHSDGIASFVLTLDSPMPWNVWLRAMDTLMAKAAPGRC
jgi:G3E family GTPase